MATITPLENKMSGKVFRETLNANFTNLNQDTAENRDNILKNYLRINTVANDMDEFYAGYDRVLVSSTTSESGTVQLPQNGSSDNVTVVGQDVFEQETGTLDTAIKNVIKGDYLQAGDNVTLTKTDSGVTISATTTTPVNEDWQHSNPNLLMNSDWRHPSSHRNVWSFIKSDDTTETEAKHCIDCWEVNYPNRQGAGYTFWDAEEEKYVAYQGASPTDPTNLDMYATLSQSFPDNWGDFLIGKKLNLSVAVSTSYSDYQSGIYDIYSYSFTAQQGYTGWMSFQNLDNVQFGIHFNTVLGEEPNERIENEITIRFDNIWVYALKLEIGETPTLKYDLMQPVDYYKQARDCEKYIKSSVSDGTSPIITIEEYSNSTQFINDNLVFVFQSPKSFVRQPDIEIYNVSGSIVSGNDFLQVLVNGTTYTPTAPITLNVTNHNPGTTNIYIQTNITKQQIMTALGLTELKDIYSITVVCSGNIVLSCEETYNS